MKSVCFYFQVHQPYRLKTYRFFEIGKDHHYYDDFQNRAIMRRVAEKCYLPANRLFLELIKEYGDRFKISYSISGTALDQFEAYAPDVLESFRDLARTGCVEFLAETYSHSLSSLKSYDEFKDQVEAQKKRIEDLIGYTPKTFRNTELIYSDEIGQMVSSLGFNTMLTEGAKHILGWKSPNFMYANAIEPKLKLLLKNFRLSDDIAFRFSERAWSEWPLTTDKFVDWLNAIDPEQEVVNLFMDYETFGEHQWEETGIFEFLRQLPARVFSHSNFTFNTPDELNQQLQPVSPIHVPYPISWADEERDLTAWLGNELQDEAFHNLYLLEAQVKRSNNPDIQRDWRYLQTSDHFYYMCTKWFSDGDVHKYFNPYGSPYDAFINYMNILSDFKNRLDQAYPTDVDERLDENILEEKVGNLKDDDNFASTELEEENSKEMRKTVATRVEKAPKKRGRLRKDGRLKFVDLVNLSTVNLKKVLRVIDLETLAIGLIGVEEEFQDIVLSKLGKRALKSYEELEINLAEIKQSDIVKCRTIILKEMRRVYETKPSDS